MKPLYEGLKQEIANIPTDYVPEQTPIGMKMDEYLKEHHM